MTSEKRCVDFAKRGNESIEIDFFPNGRHINVEKEKKMAKYRVIRECSVAGKILEKDQIIIHDGNSADIIEGDNYVAVSVFMPEETLKLAVKVKILFELPE